MVVEELVKTELYRKPAETFSWCGGNACLGLCEDLVRGERVTFELGILNNFDSATA